MLSVAELITRRHGQVSAGGGVAPFLRCGNGCQESRAPAKGEREIGGARNRAHRQVTVSLVSQCRDSLQLASARPGGATGKGECIEGASDCIFSWLSCGPMVADGKVQQN